MHVSLDVHIRIVRHVEDDLGDRAPGEVRLLPILAAHRIAAVVTDTESFAAERKVETDGAFELSPHLNPHRISAVAPTAWGRQKYCPYMRFNFIEEREVTLLSEQTGCRDVCNSETMPANVAADQAAPLEIDSPDGKITSCCPVCLCSAPILRSNTSIAAARGRQPQIHRSPSQNSQAFCMLP